MGFNSPGYPNPCSLGFQASLFSCLRLSNPPRLLTRLISSLAPTAGLRQTGPTDQAEAWPCKSAASLAGLAGSGRPLRLPSSSWAANSYSPHKDHRRSKSEDVSEPRIWQTQPRVSGNDNIFTRVLCLSPFRSNSKPSRGAIFNPRQFLGRLVTCINNAELAITILAATGLGVQPRFSVRGVLHLASDTRRHIVKKKKKNRQGHAPQVESTPITARSYHTGYIPSKGRGMECLLTQTPARRSLRSAGLKSFRPAF